MFPFPSLTILQIIHRFLMVPGYERTGQSIKRFLYGVPHRLLKRFWTIFRLPRTTTWFIPFHPRGLRTTGKYPVQTFLRMLRFILIFPVTGTFRKKEVEEVRFLMNIILIKENFYQCGN